MKRKKAASELERLCDLVERIELKRTTDLSSFGYGFHIISADEPGTYLVLAKISLKKFVPFMIAIGLIAYTAIQVIF
jgi:hypothetical protein